MFRNHTNSGMSNVATGIHFDEWEKNTYKKDLQINAEKINVWILWVLQ